MRSVRTIAEVRAAVAEARADGRSIAFVPTMGFLHDGHLSLVDAAHREAPGGCAVMSLFVNPTQFAPGEDLDRYPRDFDGDVAKARARGVDLLFAPSAAEMYPAPAAIGVAARDLDARWEGAVRPGHFAGVLTVVAKLFHIVQPDVAIFGQKDIQQATLIRAMVRDLNFPIRIVVAPTVREPDGLAMSSRNTYLTPADRARALSLSRALFAVRDAFARGATDAAALRRLGEAELAAEADVRVDYFALVDPDRLDAVAVATPRTVAIVAARVGATRLIDNAVLGA